MPSHLDKYAKGFMQGERDAWKDKKDGVYSPGRPLGEMSEERRGYWDGYETRSVEWNSRA
jgi:hypothetical protein